MNLKKVISFVVVLLLSAFISMQSLSALYVNGERIDWSGKMVDGADIYYRIDSNCEYTVSIPNAVHKIMYTGLPNPDNPLYLSRTYDYNASKMDFYQSYEPGRKSIAYTSVHRKNSNGQYYAIPVEYLNNYDWIYAEVTINDAHMNKFGSVKKEAIIIHEMLHGYGLKDLYSYSNRGSIMYGDETGTATGVTQDANTVLNQKY